MNNIFDQKETNILINRINQLKPTSKPQWGKMSVDKMLAHCNVTYEMVFTHIHPKATGIKKILLKLFVKPVVVNNKPYTKNSRTAPQFIIVDAKNFEAEKERLINFINKTQDLGANHFDGKESHSFGKLSREEWNNLFYKHLNHHFSQFGV